MLLLMEGIQNGLCPPCHCEYLIWRILALLSSLDLWTLQKLSSALLWLASFGCMALQRRLLHSQSHFGFGRAVFVLRECSVRSIELILRPMDGVAYCTGCSPDPKSHKEIHFSLRHIVNSKARAKEEIMGVLTHEVVHCFQHNSGGTAPGGLIEGFAGRQSILTVLKSI